MSSMFYRYQKSPFLSRSVFLLCGVVGFFTLILVRLVDLQIVHGREYRELADENRFFTLKIPAERGGVFDRYQQPLVYNTRKYYELVDSENLFSQKNYLERETALLEMANEEEAVGYDLVRFYRYPRSLAHILGYVGPVSAEELVQDDSLDVADIVGKMGLEKKFDTLLQGVGGKTVYEVNALGKKQRVGEQVSAVTGQAVYTTLDPYLSEAALGALGQNQGSLIILDAQNGEVLAMVNSPSFDANVFGKIDTDIGKENQRKQELQDFLNDQRQVFFNRGIGGSYPPGSIFKLVTALAGLESKAIDTEKTVDDEGILKVGEYEYANWYFTQYGRTEGLVNLEKAIARSNDIFFYKTAEWTGPNALAEAARILGLGKATGIGMAGEASGLVPDPAWKEKTTGERWFLGNTYHYGIGQGDILVSPIQAAQMVQGIVNKGRICAPRIVVSESVNPAGINPGGEECKELGFSEENIDVVLRGMLLACSQGGTGYPFFLHNTLFGLNGDQGSIVDPLAKIREGAIACKTGTAEFGGADERGYRKTHGWFVATMGVKKDKILQKVIEDEESEAFDRKKWVENIEKHDFPEQIVVVALVESDEEQPYKEGSRDAGEVVKKLIDWMGV